MLLQSNSPKITTTTAEELGRALATNNDWRAMLIVAALIIFALIAERGMAAWGIRVERRQMAEERVAQDEAMAEERKRMDTLADKFIAASEKVGDNLALVSTELAVIRAVEKARINGKE